MRTIKGRIYGPITRDHLGHTYFAVQTELKSFDIFLDKSLSILMTMIRTGDAVRVEGEFDGQFGDAHSVKSIMHIEV
jgi:topoisomerase IA-like protein|tara:strand:- start:380 stop:610 length:231 start_codon:yes stop_codon:yes gene_type:complete